MRFCSGKSCCKLLGTSCTGLLHGRVESSVLGTGTKDKGKEYHELSSAKIVTISEEVMLEGPSAAFKCTAGHTVCVRKNFKSLGSESSGNL